MTVAREDKVLWSIRETAARLGISERTLYEYTAPRGTLKRIKIGTRTMYRPETVLA
jgi:predicted DNA-binding transcriptional regulator AlpA